MKKEVYAIILILLFGCLKIVAQNPYIQHFTVDDGLPSNTVYPILKDSKNFLWFGTNAGVARYDGSQFTIFSKKDGLNCNDVIMLKEDLQGRIWFFNFNGTMNFFYQNKIYNHLNAPFLDSLKSKQFFTDFYQDTDGTIYFYTFQSFEIIALNAQNQVRKYALPSKRIIVNGYERATMNVKFICGSTNNGILLYTSEGLYALGDSAETPRFLSDTIGYNYAYRINKGKYLIRATNNGDSSQLLYEYENKKLSAPIKYTLDKKIVIASAFEAEDSILWLATIDKGVFLLKNNSIINHINIREAQGVIQDHEDNMWISTSNKGIFKINPYYNSIKHFGTELFNNSGITRLHPYLDEGIWMTNGNRVYLLKENEFYSLNFSTKDSRYDQIYYLKNNSLIFGKGSYFFYYFKDIKPIEASKRISYTYHGKREPLKGFKGIAISKRSNKICAFAANYLIFPNLEGNLNDRELLYIGERIHNIFYNLDDDLVVNARENYIYRDGKLFPYQQLSGFENEIITGYLQINDSIEAINVDGDNIYLLCKNRMWNLTEVTNNSIDRKILKMSYYKNTLYLATSQNIFICNNPENIDNAQTLDLKIIDVNFDNINDLLVFRDSLYVASNDGLTIIPEKGLKDLKSHVPRPYFLSVQVNGEESDISSNELFLTGKRRIKFSFSSINYSSSPIIYSYQLEGLDEEWINETTREVVYQNLAPGDYIFRVKAQKPGTEFSLPVDFKICVSATLWQQPTFYIGIILLVAGWVFWSVHRRMKRRRLLLEMDNQLIVLEQKALQSMMNPHFIFNALGSIQNYILQSKPAEASLYLSQFARLIRQNLNAINASMINLEEEIDRLKNYLDLERLRMEYKFDYQIEFEEGFDEEDLLIPSMIIQPFVENAVWHGIAPIAGKGMIRIIFGSQTGNHIKIAIEDNGVGIKNAGSQFSKSEQHLHLGIDITRKRLQILGKKMGINTSVQYFDLSPGSSNPGIRVELVVPVSYGGE